MLSCWCCNLLYIIQLYNLKTNAVFSALGLILFYCRRNNKWKKKFHFFTLFASIYRPIFIILQCFSYRIHMHGHERSQSGCIKERNTFKKKFFFASASLDHQLKIDADWIYKKKLMRMNSGAYITFLTAAHSYVDRFSRRVERALRGKKKKKRKKTWSAYPSG